MKKNCLYTVTPWNTNIFSCGGNKHAFGDFLKKDSSSYMGNWLGADKMSGGAGSMIGALGTAVGTFGSKLIGGGYDAYGVGNGITSVGNTIGSAVSQVNPLVGGIISAGSGIIGGAVNRLWGMKTDEEALKRANGDITAMKNFTSNASTFDNVVGPAAVSNVGQVYKGGVFKKGSARRKNAALQNDLSNAVQFAYNSVDNNIANLQADQYNNLLSNYAAFGGPIGLAPMTGALGIMQADKYINAINNRTSAIAKNNTSPSFSPLGNAFAEGGGIHIKPSHKGLFTEKANRAGMGVQAYASHVLANKEDYPSSTVRQANFARNAKGWKHDAGGSLEGAFLDEFGKDPLGAVIRYNQGLEAMAAQREAEREAAAQQAAYDDMQKRMLAAETERQGLQSMLDSQGLTIQALMDAQQQNNYADDWRERMGNDAMALASASSSLVSNAADKNKTWQYIKKKLKESGRFNDTQIEGIKLNLQRESGFNWQDRSGDNGSAWGLAQWHKPRRPEDMSLDGQINHLINTLYNYDGTNHWIGEDNYNGFMNARTPEEAHYYIAKGWERPADAVLAGLKDASDNSLRSLRAFGGLLNSKNLFALGGPDDDVLGWNPVDTRSDTTRQGYHEGNMSYGADYQGPLGTAKLVLDTYAKDHNPNLITGVAPTPYLKGKPNMAYAESYMKKHGLKSFSAANGKRYVKTPDGKVKSLESLAREEEARISQGAVEELRRNAEEAKAAGVVIDKPYRSAPLRDPAVNLDATKGSINRGKSGKVSNRNAQTANDLYAFGGELGTNGTDFTNGLLEINTGSSHEENPHEGVQLGFDEQGIPNLVEEGETVYNDYVFSKRLNVPAFMRKQLGLGGSMKDEITFAAASKKIAEAAKERPNNPMDQEYMDDALGKLAQVQEAERMRMQAERQNNEMERMNALPIEGLMQGSMGLQAAYGGDVNRFDLGGDIRNWLRKQNNVPSQYFEAIAKAIERSLEKTPPAARQRNTVNGKVTYTPIYRENDFEARLENILKGKGNILSKSAAEFWGGKDITSRNREHFNYLVNELGMDKETAFELSMPSYAKEDFYKGSAGAGTFGVDEAAWKKAEAAREAEYNRLVGKRPSNITRNNITPTSKPSTVSSNQTTDSNRRRVYRSASGRVFDTNAEAARDEKEYWRNRRAEESTTQATNTVNEEPANRSTGRGRVNNVSNTVAPKSTGMFDDINDYAYDPIEQFEYWDANTNDYNSGYRDFIENKLNEDWISKVMQGNYGDMSRYLGADNSNPTLEQARALGLDTRYSDWHKAFAAAYKDYLKENGTPTEASNDSNPNNASPLAPEYQQTNPDYPQGYWGPGVDNTSFWRAAQETGYTGMPATDWQGNTTGSNPNAPIYIPDDATVESMTTPSPLELPSVLEKRRNDPNDPMHGVGNNDKVKPLPTWMRYAPVFGAGIMTLTDALGLTNKPDYTYANKIEAAANRLGHAPNIKYTPIGDYMRYTPLDRLFYANQLQANARATDRALTDTSGGNRGVAQAAMLANGYNTNNNLGNLYRQAEEYNLAQREKVADFNRRTNMFNSQMGLEADMANARYRQQAANYQLQGLAQAAAMREAIDQRVGAARSANITNLLDNLGALGTQNFALNQINSDRSRRHGVGSNGVSYDKIARAYGNNAFGGEIERNKKNKKQGRRSK